MRPPRVLRMRRSLALPLLLAARASRACPASCYGETCDAWAGYSCATAEDWGCDCAGCACANTDDAAAKDDGGDDDKGGGWTPAPTPAYSGAWTTETPPVYPL